MLSIHLRADQIIGGTAINFLALGLTGYLYIDIYGAQGTPTDIPGIPSVNLGSSTVSRSSTSCFGDLNLMIWVAIILVPLSWIVLFKTPLGLRIRAVGEHPKAADTVGISVYGIRYGAVVLSGMLAASGGAYLSIGFLNSFNENMTAGRGFIALAAVIFGNWRPFGAAAACLLFGFSSALAQRLPEYSDSAAVLFQALPVRADADRRRGCRRSLDPAGRRGSPVQEILMGSRRAAWSVVLGVLAPSRCRWRSSRRAIRARTTSCMPASPFPGRPAGIGASFSRGRRGPSTGPHSAQAGGKAATWGRALGILGLCLAASATIAVAVYGVLTAAD